MPRNYLKYNIFIYVENPGFVGRKIVLLDPSPRVISNFGQHKSEFNHMTYVVIRLTLLGSTKRRNYISGNLELSHKMFERKTTRELIIGRT